MTLMMEPAGPGLWTPPRPEDFGAYLPVPDPITFVIGEKWLNRPLYPRQATMLKIIFLRVDLLTEYDRKVIAEWEESFARTGNNGILPGVIDRMTYLKEQGYPYFREILLVMGRRAGKGYISALCMAYVLWQYMALYDPQLAYGIDRDKQLRCLIYAGRKEQARDNLWRDLVQIIQGGTCFQKYISKPMGESLSVRAPADTAKEKKLRAQGILSGLDAATFRIDPLPATPMSGRGGAGFMLGFDEMAHMVATGANRSSEEVWVAATPSLDQFGKSAFIACPSSPWEMTGQFYVEWQHAQEIDEHTKQWAYPEIFMAQLASWEIYYDWAIAHEIELFPEEFIGDLHEYKTEELPKLGKLKKAVQDYDEAMKRLEKADPDMFAVERLSHWQTTLDAYLHPERIGEMFQRAEERGLGMTTKGLLQFYYKGHADPSIVNDNFGVAVAHVERNELGYDTVVFDYISHWDPADFPNHTIDYLKINEELWDLIKGFPIDDFTFDQYQSQHFIADFTKRALSAGMPKRINIGMVPSTAPYNLSVAENFKIALNQGWITAPYYEQADLELRFLQFKNGKVTHQTAGPVQHDDVARSMMEVVYALLNRQVGNFLMQGVPMTGAISGGISPWMSKSPDAHDVEVLNQFSAKKRTRTGVGPVNAGRRGFQNGPLPRTPSRMPGYRGR